MNTNGHHEPEDRPAPEWLRKGVLGMLLLAVSLGLTSCAWFPWTQEVSVSLVPAVGAVYTSVSLVGEGFGDVQGDGVVLFDGVAALIETWTDMLITALHNAGLVCLTHTPSPMQFLRKILGRPDNETAMMILVVGYPEQGTKVPDLYKKKLEEIALFI